MIALPEPKSTALHVERSSPALSAMLANSADGYQTLQPLKFSTLDLPSEEQFSAWRDSFEPLLNLMKPDHPKQGFTGQQIIWDLGSLVLCQIETQAVNFAHLAARSKYDMLDHWVITLPLRGEIRTAGAGHSMDCMQGITQIHRIGGGYSGGVTDAELLMLFVPRDWSGDVTRTLESAEFTTLDTGMGRLFSDYLVGLASRLPMLDRQDIPEVVRATRAMILACVAPSVSCAPAAGRGSLTMVLLEKSRQIVQAKLYDPDLDAETLRRALGISRTRLYRLFEPLGGVMRYIQHRRLVDAHEVLSDPADHRNILEIAEERGYNDGSEFSRAFKREFGYTPSDVRKGYERNVPQHAHSAAEEGSPVHHLRTVLRQLRG